MAVLNDVQFDVKPGRVGEFVEVMAENVRVIERLGGKARLLRATLAGPTSGKHTLVVEGAETVAEWGGFWDAYWNDPESQRLVERSRNDPTYEGRPRYLLAADLVEPLGSGERGRVLHAVTNEVIPGRMDDFLELSELWRKAALDSGALNVRLLRILIGGEGSGLVVGVGEYRDMAAFGEAFHKRTTDPEFQRNVFGRGMSSGAPANHLGQSVWTDITPE